MSDDSSDPITARRLFSPGHALTRAHLAPASARVTDLCGVRAWPADVEAGAGGRVLGQWKRSWRERGAGHFDWHSGQPAGVSSVWFLL